MKTAIVLVLLIATNCTAQEFKIHPNGLIYDESTMDKLAHVVDSLNLKYKTCGPAFYVSRPQGRGMQVEIKNKRQLQAIKSGISPVDYARRFSRSVTYKDHLIYAEPYNYKDERFIALRGIAPTGDISSVHIKTLPDKTPGWVVDESGESAYYIHVLEISELPERYARLVQYADCLIDTTSALFFSTARPDRYREPDDTSKIGQFIAWTDSYPNRPVHPEPPVQLTSDQYDSLYDAMQDWDSARVVYVHQQLKTSQQVKALFMRACNEAFATGTSDRNLERYAAPYLTPAQMLNLKRGRIVRGFCSMDDGPRLHAVEICMLAAITTQWEVFVRSHLDIMNDNFSRNSDGSYAWAARKTYLKELEVLDINVIDLLLGTVLTVSNAGENHYEGNRSRVGRALTDVADKDALEKRLEGMIVDPALDMYNRMEIYWLYRSYVRNLDDIAHRDVCTSKIVELEKQLPEEIQRALVRSR